MRRAALILTLLIAWPVAAQDAKRLEVLATKADIAAVVDAEAVKIAEAKEAEAVAAAEEAAKVELVVEKS